MAAAGDPCLIGAASGRIGSVLDRLKCYDLNTLKLLIETRRKTDITLEEKDDVYVGGKIVQELLFGLIEKLKGDIDKVEIKTTDNVDLLARQAFFMSDKFIECWLRPFPTRDAANLSSLDGSYTKYFNELFNVGYSEWRESELAPLANDQQCLLSKGGKSREELQGKGNIECYLCGRRILPTASGQSTMECEHVLAILAALSNLWLVQEGKRGTYKPPDEILALLGFLEYEWSHRCCNQIKSNYDFIKFDTVSGKYRVNMILVKYIIRAIEKSDKYDCGKIKSVISQSQEIKLAARFQRVVDYMNNSLNEAGSKNFYDLVVKLKVLSALSPESLKKVLYGNKDAAESAAAAEAAAKEAEELLKAAEAAAAAVKKAAEEAQRIALERANNKVTKGIRLTRADNAALKADTSAHLDTSLVKEVNSESAAATSEAAGMENMSNTVTATSDAGAVAVAKEIDPQVTLAIAKVGLPLDDNGQDNETIAIKFISSCIKGVNSTFLGKMSKIHKSVTKVANKITKVIRTGSRARSRARSRAKSRGRSRSRSRNKTSGGGKIEEDIDNLKNYTNYDIDEELYYRVMTDITSDKENTDTIAKTLLLELNPGYSVLLTSDNSVIWSCIFEALSKNYNIRHMLFRYNRSQEIADTVAAVAVARHSKDVRDIADSFMDIGFNAVEGRMPAFESNEKKKNMIAIFSSNEVKRSAAKSAASAAKGMDPAAIIYLNKYFTDALTEYFSPKTGGRRRVTRYRIRRQGRKTRKN